MGAYNTAAQIPLIKSPSLRVPRPVELPPDIHPLPESVNPYFVYPFTLESHIVTLESSRRSTFAAHTARREAYLRSREDEKDRRKREALRRIAPGFEPHGGPLVPTRGPMNNTTPINADAPGPNNKIPQQHTRTVMGDLVDQLAALEGAPTNSDSSVPLS